MLADADDGVTPEDAYIYVRVASVLSIEVRYRRAGAAQIGFQYRAFAGDEA